MRGVIGKAGWTLLSRCACASGDRGYGPPHEKIDRDLAALFVAASGCYQERNKSIELMNQGVEMGRQKLYRLGDPRSQDRRSRSIRPTRPPLQPRHRLQGSEEVGRRRRRVRRRASSTTPTTRRCTTSSAPRSSRRRRSPTRETEFEEALKIDPKLYKAHYRLGVVLQARGEVPRGRRRVSQGDRGQPALRAAVPEARQPVPRQRLRQRGGAGVPERDPRQRLRRRGAPGPGRGAAEAEAVRRGGQGVQEARVELNPELYLAYYNIGHTYKLLGDKKNAKEWLQKFVKNYASKAGPELAKAASDEIYALDAP